jgi:putative phosphoesterase
MKKIGLLSDTHGHIHDRVKNFLKDCNEIWHAGDIGTMSVIEELEKIAPIKAVYGNIDGHSIRSRFKEDEIFICEGLKIYLTHIGGYPGRYSPRARKIIDLHLPDIFISGHSHILKVMPDKKRKLLHINPGAAGNSGFHKSITCIRFELDKGRIDNLEVFDLDRKKR